MQSPVTRPGSTVADISGILLSVDETIKVEAIPSANHFNFWELEDDYPQSEVNGATVLDRKEIRTKAKTKIKE